MTKIKKHVAIPAKKCVHFFKCMFDTDCEAMANGTNEGGLSTFLIIIIIGGIIYLVSK